MMPGIDNEDTGVKGCWTGIVDWKAASQDRLLMKKDCSCSMISVFPADLTTEINPLPQAM